MLCVLVSAKSPYTNYSFTATEMGTDAVHIETTALQKAPFSIIRAGRYDWIAGDLFGRGGQGFYWSLHSTSVSDYTNGIYFTSQQFNTLQGHRKPDGFPVRCVVR